LADARSAKRKRTAVAVMCAVMIIAVLFAVVIAGTKGTNQAATTTTSADPLADLRSSTTTAPAPTGPAASLPTVSTGATIAGQVPCPAEDGSSPRTTGFSQPIPTCIDPTLQYNAAVHTSAGDINILLDQRNGTMTQTINSFVVLARYHYWDGAPFTNITPNNVGVVANPVAGGPGYTLPNQSPPQGNIFALGYFGLLAGAGDAVDPGSLQIELGQDAADLPKNTPIMGLMLDGLPAVQAIKKAGTQSGAPTQVITINSITVTPSPTAPGTSAPPAP
jgi:cyclophilin family peptidyl-prolyl cis-trans isomerase